MEVLDSQNRILQLITTFGLDVGVLDLHTASEAHHLSQVFVLTCGLEVNSFVGKRG